MAFLVPATRATLAPLAVQAAAGSVHFAAASAPSSVGAAPSAALRALAAGAAAAVLVGLRRQGPLRWRWGPAGGRGVSRAASSRTTGPCSWRGSAHLSAQQQLQQAPTSREAVGPRTARAAVGRNAAAAAVLEAPQVASKAPPKKVRVRFAPSPTGVLHVGGARTALFNWLYAQSQGGEMILRVEDTDEKRSTAASEAAIIEGLKWCGISWQEGPDVGGPHGPYRQSERVEAGIYEKMLEKLVAAGKAYRCFLTPEELDAMRAEAERNEQAFVVDSMWANATEAQVKEMLDKGAPYVYRFRVPRDQELYVNDLVLGEVTWNSDDLGGDFVIMRNGGMPMYNFGVVVDDAMMQVTHVFRAQEHLMNTPRQILIYKALGLPVPEFGHMPLILAPDRSKLSKRHGAVAVGDYQKQGYLASGMVNYLAQLGWNDGTNKEIYGIQELVQAFKMERMSKVAAIFDKDKFKWVNGHHVRLLKDDEAVERIGEQLVKAGIVREAKGEFVRQAALLLRERISVLTEAADELKSIMAYDLEGLLKSEKCKEYVDNGSLKETAQCLMQARADGAFGGVGKDPDVFKSLAKRIAEARGGVKKKALLAPLRLCLTASDHGPDMAILFEMMHHQDDNVLCPAPSLDARLDALKVTFNL